MKDCLFLKLKSQINNDSLQRLGEIPVILHFEGIEEGSLVIVHLADCEGKIRTPDPEDSFIRQETEVRSAEGWNLQVKFRTGKSYRLFVESQNILIDFWSSYFNGNIAYLEFDFNTWLSYLKSVNYLRYFGPVKSTTQCSTEHIYNVIAENNSNKKGYIMALSIIGENFIGDIAYLGKCCKATRNYLSIVMNGCTGLSGNVTDFLDNMAANYNGDSQDTQTSILIKDCPNINKSYSGGTFSDVIKVTFKTDGTWELRS